MANSSTNTIINTGNTLSVMPNPGANFALGATNSNSIFTFGNFALEQSILPDNIVTNTPISTFTPFSTLGSFSSATFNASAVINEKENQLNPKKSDPNSYSYFGSFYTKIASSVNDIIASFPYAIIGNSILNYTNNIFDNTSNFSIPISGLTNNGNVIFSSGYTTDNALIVNSNITTLYNNTQQYGIQLSATTSATTPTLNIVNYSYTSGNTGTLIFTVSGFLFPNATGTTSTIPVFIRPTPQAFGQYNRTLSNLEHQILNEQVFLVPDPDSDTFENKSFIWPKSDGFNIDGNGIAFQNYVDSLLTSAEAVDNSTTNWMRRTMIPDSYIELDTDTQIYQKLINVYAEEFDKIKVYQDNLAYLHSVNYNNEESIPTNFLNKLSDLLGFKFVNGFNNSDIFDYLSKEDEDGMTLSDYNSELWKRMLVNINWIYKKKGTRDALMFIFKLIGTPDELLIFNEFVYNTIQSSSFPTLISEGGSNVSDKINMDYYINYEASNYIFQEGGSGRGNGQKYLDQWSPEFTLNKQIDNLKIRTGDTVFATESIVNSKELELNISPANAIESDMFTWYGLGLGTWLWSSTGTTVSPFNVLPFSGMSVPFEWQVLSPSDVFPSDMSGSTVSRWLNFVFSSNIDPTTRKTLGSGHNWYYQDLKKIYMTYMLWTNNQNSNRLTFGSLEEFLALIERNIFGYLPQLIPATTILEGALVYRNTLFNRQKFVYPKGINDGSEFKLPLPVSLDNVLFPIKIVATINENINDTINSVVINSTVNPQLNSVLSSTFVNSNIILEANLTVPAFKIESKIHIPNDLTVNKQRNFKGTAITFPQPIVLVMA